MKNKFSPYNKKNLKRKTNSLWPLTYFIIHRYKIIIILLFQEQSNALVLEIFWCFLKAH